MNTTLLHNDHFIILIVFAFIFGIVTCVYSASIHADVYGMIYTAPIIICFLMSMSLSIHYKKSINYARGFLFFGLANLVLLMAELLWLIMPYLEISQYASYPDIFYMMYNVLVLIFPLFILRHYKIHFYTVQYFIVFSSVMLGVIIYLVLSNDVNDFSFWLGLMFALVTSTMIGIIIMTMLALRNTNVFRVWIIITCAFFINTISDIWYYSTENTTNWHQSDWTNVLWFVSYLFIIFALYTQKSSYVVNGHKITK